jgi:hypothetical protein
MHQLSAFFIFFIKYKKNRFFFLYVPVFFTNFGGIKAKRPIFIYITDVKKESTIGVIDNCRGRFDSCAANSRQQ